MREEQSVNPASEQSLHEYVPSPVVRDEYSEGPLTRVIERQAAKVPSDVFLFGALILITAALIAQLRHHAQLSRLLAMLPAVLLLLGLYNKVVKTLRPH